MNCLLHGMEGDDEGVVHLGNALGDAGKALPRADIILANPPLEPAKAAKPVILAMISPIKPATSNWHFANISTAI